VPDRTSVLVVLLVSTLCTKAAKCSRS